MRCHFVWDEESKQKVLIPGCGGSLHREDLSNCWCQPRVKSAFQYEKEAYNKELKEWREENAHLLSENNKLIRIIEKLINQQQ